MSEPPPPTPGAKKKKRVPPPDANPFVFAKSPNESTGHISPPFPQNSPEDDHLHGSTTDAPSPRLDSESNAGPFPLSLGLATPGVMSIPAAGSRRPTLLERRNKKDRGMSISAVSGLCMDAITDSTRDGIVVPDENPKPEFRGWSRALFHEPQSDDEQNTNEEPVDKDSNLNDILSLVDSPKEEYTSKTALKVVAYNILAPRLVSTDRYPDCHPLILGEEYRMRLLKEEIESAKPSILLLSEISVDAFEKSLGDFLRTQLDFYGEFIVITDKAGEPRCPPLGVPRQLESISSRLSPARGESAGETRTVPVIAGPRASSTIASPHPQVKKAAVEASNVPPNLAPVTSNGGSFSQPGAGGEGRRTEMDGIAIFYNKNRFTLMEKVPIRFNVLAQSDFGLTAAERKKLQVDSHNVALVLVLRDHLIPSNVYIVGCVHLIWQRIEAQLWQSARVTGILEQLKSKYQSRDSGHTTRSHSVVESSSSNVKLAGTPNSNAAGEGLNSGPYSVTCILGGDFNIDRANSTFTYLCDGVVPTEAPVFKYWKADNDANGGQPPPAYERRTTSQFPTPPPTGNGLTTPVNSGGSAFRMAVARRSSPSPDEEPSMLTPTPPIAPLKKKAPVPNAHPILATSEGGGNSGSTSTTQNLSGTLSGKTAPSSASMANGENAVKRITAAPQALQLSFPSPLVADPGTPSSFKRSSNPSSNEPSQTGGEPSSEITNIFSTLVPTTPPKVRTGSGRSPSGSPIMGDAISLGKGGPSGRFSFNRLAGKVPPTHSLRFIDAYGEYCKKHPRLVSAVNPSTNMEGKVLDHILFEDESMECVRVMRLGELRSLPAKNIPSDHYMVGAILEPRRRRTLSPQAMEK